MGRYQSASRRNARLVRRVTQESSAASNGENRTVCADENEDPGDFNVKDGVSKGSMFAPAFTTWC